MLMLDLGYVLDGWGILVQVSTALLVLIGAVGVIVLLLRTFAQLAFFVRQIKAVPRGQRRAWVDRQLAAMRRRRGGGDDV